MWSGTSTRRTPAASGAVLSAAWFARRALRSGSNVKPIAFMPVRTRRPATRTSTGRSIAVVNASSSRAAAAVSVTPLRSTPAALAPGGMTGSAGGGVVRAAAVAGRAARARRAAMSGRRMVA